MSEQATLTGQPADEDQLKESRRTGLVTTCIACGERVLPSEQDAHSWSDPEGSCQ